MQVQTKFTPGPLTYFVGNANGRGLVRIETGPDAPEAGIHIASMPRGTQSVANADEIVRRFNAFDEMYAALKAWERLVVELYPAECNAPEHKEEFRAVYALYRQTLTASAKAVQS